jgi:hypothetical protein
MWTGTFQKRQFLDMLSSAAIESSGLYDSGDGAYLLPPQSGWISVCWEERPSGDNPIPELIVVPKGEVREFIAWVSTYLPWLRPFTAFCRVVDDEVALRVIRSSAQKPAMGDYAPAYIAAVIGECMEHFASRDIRRLNPTSAMSTYSYALARALSLDLSNEDGLLLTERWLELRRIAGQPDRVLKLDVLREIWDVLAGMRKRSPLNVDGPGGIVDRELIEQACESIKLCGRIEGPVWQRLSHLVLGPLDLNTFETGSMSSTREDRVRLFEKCAETIRRAMPAGWTLASFLCAYLASQIAPGSAAHAPMVEPFVRQFPGILVWYYVCAGLYPRTAVLSDNDGLGWRVLREVLRRETVFQRPQGDIAFDEFKVLVAGKKHDIPFLSASHTHLSVELFPRVYSVIVWPSSLSRVGISDDERAGTTGLFMPQQESTPGEAALRERLNSLSRLLDQAHGMCHDITDSFKADAGYRPRADRRGHRREKRGLGGLEGEDLGEIPGTSY